MALPTKANALGLLRYCPRHSHVLYCSRHGCVLYCLGLRSRIFRSDCAMAHQQLQSRAKMCYRISSLALELSSYVCPPLHAHVAFSWFVPMHSPPFRRKPWSTLRSIRSLSWIEEGRVKRSFASSRVVTALATSRSRRFLPLLALAGALRGYDWRL